MSEPDLANRKEFTKENLFLWLSFLFAGWVLTMCGFLFMDRISLQTRIEIDLVVYWGISIGLFSFLMAFLYNFFVDRIIGILFSKEYKYLIRSVIQVVKYSTSILYFSFFSVFIYYYYAMVSGILNLGGMTYASPLIAQFYSSTLKGVITLLLVQISVTSIVLFRISMKKLKSVSYWRIALCSLIPTLFTVIQVVSSPIIWVISSMLYLLLGIIFWVLRGGSDL